MITTINEWKEINESNNIIENIKKELISEEYTSWEEYIDSQELGDCQLVTSIIKNLNLQNVETHFGEIVINDPTDKEYFDKIMTHHWITINNVIFEFSKGTLKDFVNFNNIYSIENDDEIEYNTFR
jgi:hypothetical protein